MFQLEASIGKTSNHACKSHIKNICVVFCMPKTLHGVLTYSFLIHSFSTFFTKLFLLPSLFITHLLLLPSLIIFTLPLLLSTNIRFLFTLLLSSSYFWFLCTCYLLNTLNAVQTAVCVCVWSFTSLSFVCICISLSSCL